MEGRIDQDKLESAIVSLIDLLIQRESQTDRPMSDMEPQTDERLKLMSELMHRRDIDVNKRTVDLMTIVQCLTLGIKIAVTQSTASRLPSVPVAFNVANIPSTKSFLAQQPTYP